MFVDSHCHLNFLEAPQAVLARARAAQVEHVLCIGVDERSMPDVLACADRNEDVWASAGEHPGSVSDDQAWIEPYLQHPQVVAVGETGLDYLDAEDEAERERQRVAFSYQLDLAERHRLPVIVHTRGAQADTLAALRNCPGVTGVLHCFTESWDMAEAALALGFYISISGIVTFKNAENVREVGRRVPRDRLLIETDSPWLAPVPHRGQPNEPAYVAHTARVLAETRGEPLEDLARQTKENFFRLFQA